MSPAPRRLLAIAAVLVVLAGTACTDDDGSSPGGSTTSTAPATVDDGVIDDVSLEDCPPDTDDAGVSPPRGGEPGVVRLVTVHPSAGAFAADAAISRGALARFEVANRRGGVEVAGERYLIEVDVRNDAGDPVATQERVTEQFSPDGSPAFAAFGLVGTDNVLAVRDRLSAWCVPDVFPVSASAAISARGGWSVGAPVVLETTEAAALVAHLRDTRPEARVALLVPGNDRGERIEAAFDAAVLGSSVTVVAVGRLPVGVDSDVRDEVTALSASGADVFVDAAELLSCPRALTVARELEWPSLVLAAGGCAEDPFLAQAGPAADGVLAATNLMAPASERWRSNARVVAYRDAVDEWDDDNPEGGIEPDDPLTALGWTMGDLFVRALSQSSGVTRSELMESLTEMEVEGAGLVFDGITLATGPDDRWLGESARVSEFDAGSGTFDPIGEISSHEGGQAVPEELRPDS